MKLISVTSRCDRIATIITDGKTFTTECKVITVKGVKARMGLLTKKRERAFEEAEKWLSNANT